MKKTLGEFRVRTEFNPSNDGLVDKLKQASAAYVDLVNSINVPTREDEGVLRGEIERWKSLAKTEIESASHWAVKAATAKSGDADDKE